MADVRLHIKRFGATGAAQPEWRATGIWSKRKSDRATVGWGTAKDLGSFVIFDDLTGYTRLIS